MEGKFLRKKFNIVLYLLFVCGVFFIGLYIFLNIVDSQATDGLLSFLILGILIILVVIPSWLLNFGAFIRIDKDSINAKYHWFSKIDCKLSDVTFAMTQVHTLIIQLKDGKTHTILGVENSWSLASIIRRKMPFELTERPEALIKKLTSLRSKKEKNLIYTCLGVALMFINIFATVFLTGARETNEFNNVDWTIFVIFGIIEIAIVIFTFYFAHKTGKANVPIKKLQYTIQRGVVETKPILPGNVIKVFTDENYSGRITLFGYPNQDSVYYVVQRFASDFTLFKSFESEIFKNAAQLQDDFEELIDITEKVLH